jgi:hypothetical protein
MAVDDANDESVVEADQLAEELDYQAVTELVKQRGEDALFDREVIRWVALEKQERSSEWVRFASDLSDYSVNANEYQGMVSNEVERLVESEDDGPEETTPDAPPEPDTEYRWEVVAERIRDLYDGYVLRLAEAFATVPIRMMMADVTDCPMVIAIGNASTRKSTVAGFFGDIDHSSTHDDITPKAFVSHNADGEKGEFDLLPRIKQRIIVTPEMGTWFRGDNIDEYMAFLARVADGDGLVRSTGAQGTHGYEADYPGEYRFGLIGCTTPPGKRAWNEMAHVGSRFLFHEMPKINNRSAYVEKMKREDYKQKREEMTQVVTDWWRTIWHEYDGEIEDVPELTDDQHEAMVVLAEILGHARAIDYGSDGGKSGTDTSEGPLRATAMLTRMAQSRAIMYGRDSLNDGDLELCARVVFSSMPQYRRPLVKMLCGPDHSGPYEKDDVTDRLDLSAPTALDRMKEMGRLGVASYSSEPVQGGEKAVIKLAQKSFRGIFESGKVPWPFET